MPAPTTTTKSAVDFLRFALAQRGDDYQFNTGDPRNPDPTEFDCSGLVRWAAVQCGYAENWPDIGDWSWSVTQIAICKKAGTTLTVEEAIQTAGALLFRDPKGGKSGHVAISLGNGSVMHAMSEKMGVDVSTAASDYDSGGYLPDMHFPGPISGLPSGFLGEGPVKTGGGFRGATTGPVTPIETISAAIVTEIIADKEDDDMLFLARLDTNPNLWMRGNGVQASRIRAAHLDDVVALLVDPNRGPVYHNPIADGCPAITDADDVPLLTAEELVAHLGDETEESAP
jgi:cell wall-associated NlpC family hydrolase